MSTQFSYQKLEEKLRFYLKNKRNVLLEGRHGTAKTTLICKIFNEVYGEGNWLYFSASTLDPWVDFVGVPRTVKDEDGEDVLEFVRPQAMKKNRIRAIYVDEYNRSEKKLRNALMELIQFKSINGKKFDLLEVVWASVNPFTDEELENNYDVEPIDPAQLDRFQIQIKLPFAPDSTYFIEKFGEDWAKSAIEWWTALKPEMKDRISPRRLDYALEVAQFGGELVDVLPFETNPQKLEVTLQVGNIQDKLLELFNDGDYEKAQTFVNVENNYQASKKIICESPNFLKFFLPLIEEERLSSLFFANDKAREFMLRNPLYFTDMLRSIISVNPESPHTFRIKSALKHVSGIELQSA
jgi:hypothetical protein